MRNGKTKLITALLGTCVLGAAIFVVLAAPQVAASSKTSSRMVSFETTSSPSPSPSPSATSLPPASAATIKWATKHRAHAKREWKKWNKARAAFNLRAVPFSRACPRSPTRLATEDTWMSVGKRWQHAAVTYQRKYNKLRHKMLYPGGSSCAERWMPLARFLGWHESELSLLCSIMNRESSGRPEAKNPSSTASGLAQFLAFWWDGSDAGMAKLFHSHGLAYPWNPFDAEQTLSHWLVAVRHIGWGPWAL